MLRALWHVLAIAAATGLGSILSSAADAAECSASAYLTFDTGNMRHAEDIAAILLKHHVKASFFLANEKTTRGDFALDASWARYWRARTAEGHAFGSHTWRHGRIGGRGESITYRPQFGEGQGRTLQMSASDFCSELRRPAIAFHQHTGQSLDAIWRAPGGRVTAAAVAAARDCGFAHVHWADAGFLGDELPSESHPNAQLLKDALHNVRDGDVLMAHLGIWSRKDPFAPMIDPLITGLKQRGFCFKTLTQHPEYRSASPLGQLASTAPARVAR